MFLYALTILVSAFLLFQVQPVIAKIILPWFGGSAAVWTVCLLFFQLVLLLGYLYAHAVVRYLKPRVQVSLHLFLLLASLLALPIYPRDSLKPAGTADPTAGILVLLAVTVGLPYFLLSTTGPLLQAWYARRFKGAMPYRLYALSNAGSMFALISYPVLFEPNFTTHQQAAMWSIGFGLFMVCCAVTAYFSMKAPAIETHEDAMEDGHPPASRYALWMALPAVASILLLAITNHLSANVAAIPFLWVLPLTLYLLSFILCFEGSGWYRRNPYLQLLAVALGSMAYALNSTLDRSVPIHLAFFGNVTLHAVWLMVALYGLGLFTCCMVCHGELARLKPHPRYLTHFYLMMSAGGALGGIVVGLIAPRVFRNFYELPLGLVACAVVVVIALKQDADLTWFRRWYQPAPLISIALAAALAVYVGIQIRDFSKGARVLVRNFYGALKVEDSGPPSDLDAVRSLTHGTINHGNQFLNPARRRWPTTYYGPNTGVGIAIRDKSRSHAVRIGVIGLGTGTIFSYGREGDFIRYYEINPLVLRLASTEFTYMRDCPCQHEVTMGDARLSLERQLADGQPQNFDVLAVDAFSSDSIPVHLLTEQAMELYFQHLRPDGILAVHISNRYLDLQPVVAGETAATGHVARLVDTEDDDDAGVFGATWILVAAPQPGFDPEILNQSAEIASRKKVRLWTDDYSNLFQILK